MIKKILLFLLISLTIGTTASAQEYYRRNTKYVDTATFMVWAAPAFSMQFPFGNGYLASTFNYNFCIGLDVTMKTQSNWTFDVGFNYMFGSTIRKQVPQILGSMAFLHPKNEKEDIPVIFNGAGNNRQP